MTERLSNEDLELKDIFVYLCSIPEEFFRPPTPFWQRNTWSTRTDITDVEYNQLHIYSQQLVQRVSSSNLSFVYKYFNFKKQTLGIEYKQSLRAALQNVSLLTLGIAPLLWTNNSLTISVNVVILVLVIFLIVVPYIVFVVWRNLQEFHFYDRVERLLEIAQKRSTEQNLYS